MLYAVLSYTTKNILWGRLSLRIPNFIFGGCACVSIDPNLIFP